MKHKDSCLNHARGCPYLYINNYFQGISHECSILENKKEWLTTQLCILCNIIEKILADLYSIILQRSKNKLHLHSLILLSEISNEKSNMLYQLIYIIFKTKRKLQLYFQANMQRKIKKKVTDTKFTILITQFMI